MKGKLKTKRGLSSLVQGGKIEKKLDQKSEGKIQGWGGDSRSPETP